METDPDGTPRGVGVSNMIGPKLAWASLVCGVLGWVLIPVVGFGPDIAAVVLGIIALRQIAKDDKKTRRVAHIGLWAGASKLIAMALTFLWVIIAFLRNPVAH